MPECLFNPISNSDCACRPGPAQAVERGAETRSPDFNLKLMSGLVHEFYLARQMGFGDVNNVLIQIKT